MSLHNNIIQQAQAYGLSPEYLLRLAQVESSNNPNAKNPNSSATGAFQFIDKTWLEEAARAGLADPARLGSDPAYRQEILDKRSDPAASSQIAAQFASRNKDTLKNVLGRDPHDVEMYMAHFLGPQGAQTFFERQGADGDAPAAAHLPQAAAANKNVFFDQDGTPRSYNQILNNFAGKFPMNTGQPPLMDMGNIAQVPQPVPADEGPIQPTQTEVQPNGNRRDNVMLAEGLTPKPQGDENAARMLLNISAGFLGGNGLADGFARAAAGASQAIGQKQAHQASQQAAFARLIASGVDPKQAVLALSSGDLNSMQNIQMANNKSQQGNTYYTPDGQVVRELFNKRTGQAEYHNATTGEVGSKLPQGSFRVEDSAFKTLNKNNANAQTDFEDSAIKARSANTSLSRLEPLLQKVGGGDVYATLGRLLADKTGVAFGKFDPADVGEARQIVADLKLSASARMKGQGQITEAERALLAETVPNLETNPGAAKRIIDILRTVNDREIALEKQWRNAAPEEKARGFNAFILNARDKLEAEDTFTQRKAAPNDPKPSTTSTGVKWQLKPQ